MNDDGGPAFPIIDEQTYDNHRYRTVYGGISVRDFFAAAALQGIAVAGCIAGAEQLPPDQIGKAAYAMADSLLKARVKPD